MTNTGTHTTTCHTCPETIELTCDPQVARMEHDGVVTAGVMIGSHWTGTEYVRAFICRGCQDAALAERRSAGDAFATKPRAPRKPRKPQPLYGDLRAIAQINGIRTDGTGRRVAR